MPSRKITERIEWVGAVDWNRRSFDAVMQLPNGTSYNSYIVRGEEKTALIDTVDSSFEEDLFTSLFKSGIQSLDYIVVNHAEQDHSGSLPFMLDIFPKAKVVTNEKCAELLTALLLIPGERIMVVDDRDSLSLGGISLQFLLMPWVHWPETMVTYCPEDKVLFSCDLFGAHYATAKLFEDGKDEIRVAARRYYAGIMMPFRTSIRNHLGVIEGLDIDIIAPSHGPLYNHPTRIIDLYNVWVSDTPTNDVVIAYVSMHGSTEKMVKRLTEELILHGLNPVLYNLECSDLLDVASALVDAATLVIGTPTMLFGPHPLAVSAAYLLNLLRPDTKYVAIVGSYGWGGKTVETIDGMLDHVKAERLEPVYIRGQPKEQDFAAINGLADKIADKHRSIGLLE